MKTISPFHTPFLAVILRFHRNSDCPPLPFHSIPFPLLFHDSPSTLLPSIYLQYLPLLCSPLLFSSPLFSPLLYSPLLFPFQSILHLTSLYLSYFYTDSFTTLTIWLLCIVSLKFPISLQFLNFPLILPCQHHLSPRSNRIVNSDHLESTSGIVFAMKP